MPIFKLLTILNTSFTLTWLAVLAAVWFPVPAAIVVMLCFATWLVALGLLAHRLGHSWIVWSGGALVTGPIGMIVAQVLMLKRLQASP